MAAPAVAAPQRRRLHVGGTVQGVGFRPFVHREATALGLTGQVGNDGAGVVIEVEGQPDALDRFEQRVRHAAPPLARVGDVTSVLLPPAGGSRFAIVSSAPGGRGVPVSVDVAVCDDCLREMRDPADRRYRYPFINCTACGPRFTIVRDVPYDRPRTTMAAFAMCDQCRREYEDPLDRRFHAQPVACPRCGPTLTLLDASGAAGARGDAALAAAAGRLAAGGVVAVKGLGGFHLAAVASDAAAVLALRRRKGRDAKPFALMVRDLEEARALCHVDAAAAQALSSLRRPIVLLPRRGSAPVADAVAPGLPDLGVMLPYTPLHHLLLEAVRRPLVMTSANAAEEPIVHRDEDLLARLRPPADAVLTHDRAIEVRCDDSVVRAGVDGATQVTRRARGHAPEPLRLPVPARCDILAVGAELKSTVAVARGAQLVVGQHIGDLRHAPAYTAFTEAVEHLCRLFDVRPQVVAHDLHPDYLSTAFATALDVRTLAVQHHHAHLAACMVEHGRSDGVVGVAYDGAGLGDDGSVWGGELLVGGLRSVRRRGHLLEVPLPGGDAAAREPWRMALVWLRESLGDEAARRWGERVDPRAAAVLGLAAAPGVVRTSSVGRLLDAVAALLGLCPRVTYEGQAAVELEALARRAWRGERAALPVDVVEVDRGLVLDPRPLVAQVAAAVEHGVDRAAIAAAAHRGIGAATARAAALLCEWRGLDTVALTGGVFQNVLLTETVAAALRARGIGVLVHRLLPPNDGGISAGQAAVAAALSQDPAADGNGAAPAPARP